jgi:hypothetical protein
MVSTGLTRDRNKGLIYANRGTEAVRLPRVSCSYALIEYWSRLVPTGRRTIPLLREEGEAELLKYCFRLFWQYVKRHVNIHKTLIFFSIYFGMRNREN